MHTPRSLRPSLVLALSFLLGALGGCAHLGFGSQSPEEKARARRQAYVEAHPSLAPELREAILAGKVALGMDTAMLKASLGRRTGARAITPIEDADTELTFTVPRVTTTVDFGPGGSRESQDITGETRHFVRLNMGKVVGVSTRHYEYYPCQGMGGEERVYGRSGTCVRPME